MYCTKVGSFRLAPVSDKKCIAYYLRLQNEGFLYNKNYIPMYTTNWSMKTSNVHLFLDPWPLGDEDIMNELAKTLTIGVN